MVNYGLNLALLLGLVYWIIGLIYPFIAIFLIFKRFRRMIPVSIALYIGQALILPILMIYSGMILLFHGWRLDPILQFEQLLLTGVVISLIIKDIYSHFIGD
ncbi:Ycf66 family protein [Trichocoleus sp. DQ-U1]|uniref:Ycf66 family protein n=1 Tax=Trichocoleus sp. DQ-U1 TaxID=2933926 RepID=UPI003296EBE3